MKLIICLILALAVVTSQALTEEQRRKLRQFSEECKTETGVSQEAINQAIKHEYDAITDNKIKAYSLCFAKKTKLATESGDIDVDFIKKKLKEHGVSSTQIDKIVTKCIVSKDTKEDTFYEAFKCLRGVKPGPF